ncbi:MAG: DUF3800 domain-containing protein [Candidatus Parcubacteria bacterium]|nr:DUF3800 domain-containing protein [Candidatus Parcubacteria bacterium]
MYLPPNDSEFRAFCDKRHLKSIRRSKFKEILITRLLPQLPKNSLVQVEMLDSKHNANIQIADWIAGAISWHLEKKPLGKACFDILRHNILKEGKELFKGSWQDNHKNKEPNQFD